MWIVYLPMYLYELCTLLKFSMKIALFFPKVLLIHCGIAAAFSGIGVVGRYICSMHCNVIKKMQLHKLGNQIVSISPSPKFPHPFVSQSVLLPHRACWFGFAWLMVAAITKETNDDKNNDFVLLQYSILAPSILLPPLHGYTTIWWMWRDAEVKGKAAAKPQWLSCRINYSTVVGNWINLGWKQQHVLEICGCVIVHNLQINKGRYWAQKRYLCCFSIMLGIIKAGFSVHMWSLWKPCAN